jgi:hypothetical protein
MAKKSVLLVVNIHYRHARGVSVIALGEGGARAAIVHTVGVADIAGALDRVLARNQPPLCAVTRLFPEIAK